MAWVKADQKPIPNDIINAISSRPASSTDIQDHLVQAYIGITFSATVPDKIGIIARRCIPKRIGAASGRSWNPQFWIKVVPPHSRATSTFDTTQDLLVIKPVQE